MDVVNTQGVLELRLLGPVEVHTGAGVVAGTPQQSAILAALAVDVGRPVPVELLVDRVWGSAPPDRVRRTLHTHITRLRRLLKPVPILRQASGYMLEIDPDRVDLHRFRNLLNEACNCGSAEEQARLLHEALGMWRGQPLAGLAGQWAARMRETWRHQRLDAVVAWAQNELRLGRPAEVVDTLTDLVDEYPLVEPLTAMLMRALHATGHYAQALDCYTSIRRRLADELGVDPSAELQQLHQAILRGDLEKLAGAAPTIAPMAVPAQLPTDVPGFTGRARELKRLDALLSEVDRPATAMVVATLSGTAGVGKTTLAVHWAHRVTDRFPGGQLYVNLRGVNPAGPATTPEEAIHGFLDAFDVPASRIPTTLQGQIGLYRSLLSGRRVLVVLDNARDADQVRPLLPGAPGCLAVITCRTQLVSLVAAEGAQPIDLNLLDPGECRNLLARRIGVEQVGAEPDAVEEIIATCAGLPLALAVVAARATMHASYPLAALAKELRDTRGSLEAFAGDDPATDVRTVFSWSYRALSSGAARLFRLLGIHPGPAISTAAAASLAGIPTSQAGNLLAELNRAHLINETTTDRYALHDLLRAYATEQAGSHDSKDERHAAVHRMLDHYLHTASATHELIFEGPKLITLDPPQPGTHPETVTDRAEGLAWFATEDQVLVSVVRQAADYGLDTHAWQLGWTLRNYFGSRGRPNDDLTVLHIALAATERLGDPVAQTRCLRALCETHKRLSRYDDAHTHLRRALELCEKSGDRDGQAHTRLLIGEVLEQQGHYHEALSQTQAAFEWYRATGVKWGQERSLNNLGWTYILIGQYEQAVGACEQALPLAREVNDRYGQAYILDTMGWAHHHLGSYDRAIECYLPASELFGELDRRYRKANVLAHLGDTHDAAGCHDAAGIAWQEAIRIFDELGSPEADQVRTKLDGMARPR